MSKKRVLKFCAEKKKYTLRISSVPNSVRKMLESIALTEPINRRPVVKVTETAGRAFTRDRRRNMDMVIVWYSSHLTLEELAVNKDLFNYV
jgi:hypothetical protein